MTVCEFVFREESYFEQKENGESPATEFITVSGPKRLILMSLNVFSGYKQKNLQLIATSVVKELYLVQIVQS